ncbi:MAG: adaptor protein MecA [Defluviitaleaceae bacterium]|nr:adaptor protein MecA [Defluviitaleaceae bacterium]
MKIEKINENQVKFVLSKSDLDERNIKITELAYGSEKTHRLFQEMMQQAHSECNFESDNTPLMVEAMPMGTSHVVIVVTKIAGGLEEKKSLFPLTQARNNDTYENCELCEPNLKQPSQAEKENIAIFSFNQLEDATLASKRLHDYFMGQSRLYKYNDRFFLVLQEDSNATYAIVEAEMVLHEYGEKHVSNSISEYYLTEHGETMINYQAIEKLAWYL